MDGILYLTDEQNKRRFVQIDLDLYGGDYLEDLLAGLTAFTRKDEASESLEDVIKDLKEEGIIDA